MRSNYPNYPAPSRTALVAVFCLVLRGLEGRSCDRREAGSRTILVKNRSVTESLPAGRQAVLGTNEIPLKRDFSFEVVAYLEKLTQKG